MLCSTPQPMWDLTLCMYKVLLELNWARLYFTRNPNKYIEKQNYNHTL